MQTHIFLIITENQQLYEMIKTIRTFMKIPNFVYKLSIHILTLIPIPKSYIVQLQKWKVNSHLKHLIKTENVVIQLKKHLHAFHSHNRILIEPGTHININIWRKLLSQLENKQANEILFILNTKKKETYVKKLFHSPYAILIPPKINVSNLTPITEPSRGSILPIWTLFLDHFLKKARISTGLFFRNQWVKRTQGDWAIWKYMMNKIYHQDFMLQKNHASHLLRPSLITILMSVYNEGSYLKDSLESIALQTNPNFHCVLINDASTDNTQALMEEWKKKIPNCIVLNHSQNKGKGRSMNDGLQLVKTPFVFEMDGDDWIDPDAIEKINRQLRKIDDQVIYLYGDRRRFYQLSKNPILIYRGIYKGKRLRSKKEFILTKRPYGPRIYRTKTLKEIGGWPVQKAEGNYGRLFEDFILVLKLMMKGKFTYIPNNPIYNIRVHATSQSITHLHQLSRYVNPHIQKALQKLN